jgi:hypothetical protein
MDRTSSTNMVNKESAYILVPNFQGKKSFGKLKHRRK